MKTLIIGGTGLISTAITRQLLERGDEVTLFNRGRTEARFPAGARRVTGERKEREAFESAIQGLGPFDAAIDMICYTPEDAESTLRAVRGIARQVIFCSTVDVYARPAGRYPYQEDEPHRPVSDYGRRKSESEGVFMAAHGKGEIAVTILRPAMTYGEGGRIIHSLGWRTSYLDRVRRGLPVIVHGDGTSLWVPCHIDDVAAAFVNAIGNDRAMGRAYHATGEEWLTWNGFHQTVARAIGAPEPTLVHIPTDLLYRCAPEQARISAQNFQYTTIFDNTAACSDLGFRFTIPFLEGAARTYAWLEQRNLIEKAEDDPLHDRILAAWERHSAAMETELR